MNKELKKLEELLANDRKIIEENYKEIERLNNIINEAIKFIEKNYFITGRIEEMYKILKGADKE